MQVSMRMSGIWGRYAMAALLTALVSGCSTPAPVASTQAAPVAPESTVVSTRNDACRDDRSACMYEGPYDDDEARYAEGAARRLNLAELARLRAQQ